MSLIDVAKSTVGGLVISDVLKERLSLALDQAAQFEGQVEDLRTTCADLKAELKSVQLDRDKTREALQRLQKEHEEETVIHSFLEFRRGKRTQNKWMPFCPKCHMPAAITHDQFPKVYCVASCGFLTNAPVGTTLEWIQKQLPP
jgi:hypothetical protein